MLAIFPKNVHFCPAKPMSKSRIECPEVTSFLTCNVTYFSNRAPTEPKVFAAYLVQLPNFFHQTPDTKAPTKKMEVSETVRVIQLFFSQVIILHISWVLKQPAEIFAAFRSISQHFAAFRSISHRILQKKMSNPIIS